MEQSPRPRQGHSVRGFSNQLNCTHNLRGQPNPAGPFPFLRESMTHPNAAPTPRHRLKVARLVVDDGWPISEVAARFQVSWPADSRRSRRNVHSSVANPGNGIDAVRQISQSERDATESLAAPPRISTVLNNGLCQVCGLNSHRMTSASGVGGPTEPLSIGQGGWQMSCPLNLSSDLPLRRGT